MKANTLLYDRLVADPLLRQGIKDTLKECIVIDATNVSDYYFQGVDKTEWGVNDFPNLAPPFERFFLEFRAPSGILSNGITTQWDYSDMPSRWGLCCGGAEIDEEWRDEIRGVLKRRAENPAQISQQTLDFMQAFADRARWDLSFVLYYQANIPQISHVRGPFCRWDMPIDGDGRPIVGPNGRIMANIFPIGFINRDTNKYQVLEVGDADDMELFEAMREQSTEYYGATLNTALLAISFMHCRNVSLTQYTPPLIQSSPKQRRWGIQPHHLVTYHVLDIEPMKQVLRTEGRSEKVGMQRSLHICRGHFAHYDEEHKLFGKYAGTFWIPQHVRGSAKEGVALKDYRIKKIGI